MGNLQLKYEVVTDGLRFPEGPVWMKDGSVIVVEIESGRIVRVRPDGKKEVVATPGGGPNGAAIGPDGALYVCNNGGFIFFEKDGVIMAEGDPPPGYDGGWLDRIDITTGKVTRLYDKVDGRRLAGPNDIVFDDQGGFWFTDLGKRVGNATYDGGIFYAKPDGSMIKRVVDRVYANGIGISPDKKTLYVALTYESLLIAFNITGPGEVEPSAMLPGRVVAAFAPRQWPDSFALTADGDVYVGTNLENAGIAVVNPATGAVTNHLSPDPLTTNICFGGLDFRDAWVTCSTTGRLFKTRWEKPGLRLSYYA